MFSLSSFLYTVPMDERQNIFIDQCNSINNMTLSQFNGMWLPLGKGMIVHSIHVTECKVISTKSRCPCVLEFVVSSRLPSRPSSIQPKRSQVSISPILTKPSFFQWICSFLPFYSAPPLSTKSYDMEPFSPVTEESVGNQSFFHHSLYKVIIKTRDTIRQEEMASHLINEVASIEEISTRSVCY